MCSCGSVVEHCVSSAKGCGFNSQGTECKNVNVVVMEAELIQVQYKYKNRCLFDQQSKAEMSRASE